MSETGRAERRTPPVDPRLLRYARASRGFFGAIAAISLAQTLVVIAFAWLVTQAVTGVVDGAAPSELVPTLAALSGVVALRAGLLWAREAVSSRAAARVESQLRDRLLDAVDRLGPGWLAGRSSAALAVTAGRGLASLEAYFGRYLPQLVMTVIATPLLVAVMWWQDWISGITVVVTLPLIPFFMVLIGLATQALQARQWKTLQHLASRFADTVQGLGTLKVFGRQHRAVDAVGRVTDTYRLETMKVLRVSFLSGFALEFLASISVAIIAVSIGFRLIDGSMLLAVGLFVLLLAPEAYLPLRQVGVQFHAAAEGVAATSDVFEVLDAARDRGTDENRQTAPRTTGALALRDVRVRRGDRDLPTVSFTASPGTLTLVVGPSGAGKSSLLAALLGSAEYRGSATWAGHEACSLTPASWIAWAGQRPGLSAGTVAENVALGDETPDHARVRVALAAACAPEIDPATVLGVQGSGLSGGQAQRVAVARALYRRDAQRLPVLALDEPSAALDAETESALWRSVRAQADAGAIVLLVSHRETAREIADQVIDLSPAEVPA
ncbi:thiol reductant ABC exporter subunit CydD [Microbacterium aquimaris]|uniref:Thiol reductant ABC exporter subunit CydD n=1 Tax=Microbacterium aquimaris TaxID=459816 RepID=A0ABU5N9N7_9MICO|nr:thiol reductant ABC exporter subunit CydD [Microbacterium aquimaris]MDZ8162794.1 thiol reductant ABC exporter subunit CydD [Microbacterium aquimaris]